jgi:hypothetical protein
VTLRRLATTDRRSGFSGNFGHRTLDLRDETLGFIMRGITRPWGSWLCLLFRDFLQVHQLTYNEATTGPRRTAIRSLPSSAMIYVW